MNQLAAFIYAYGYLGVFSFLMLGIVGLPVPDEWLLTFAGYLVYKGHFHIVPTLAAAILGSICGISVSYYLGHTLGIPFVRRYGQWFHITEEWMSRVHDWFDRTGRWSLLVGYFIPGVRHLAGFVAGTSKLRFPEFALFAYTGAFVWSVSFVAIGYYSGKEWASTTRTIHRDIVVGAVLAAIMILVYLFFIKKLRRNHRQEVATRNELPSAAIDSGSEAVPPARDAGRSAMPVVTGKRKTWIMFAGVVILLILGWIDYATGYEFGFFIFYFIPVSIAAWYGGRKPAIAMAAASAVCWYLADRMTHHPYPRPYLVYWETFARYLSFLTTALTTSKIREMMDNGERVREELDRALEENRELKRLLQGGLRSP